MNIPLFKVFSKTDYKIYNPDDIEEISIDYRCGEMSFRIYDSWYCNNSNKIIILPYWRTVHGKDGDFDLYDGDIFQLEASSETYRYIVRYNEKENCFMVAHTEQLQNEKNWKQNIWFRPDRTWWKDMYESRMSYLGNEHINPELLEEK